MKQILMHQIKKESMYLSYLFFSGVILFKILFYKESLLIVLRTVLAFFWLFILPGFSLMCYWHEKLSFLERFLIGIALSGSLIGIFSYHLGLFGLNIKHHIFLLPALFIAVGIILIWKKK